MDLFETMCERFTDTQLEEIAKLLVEFEREEMSSYSHQNLFIPTPWVNQAKSHLMELKEARFSILRKSRNSKDL